MVVEQAANPENDRLRREEEMERLLLEQEEEAAREEQDNRNINDDDADDDDPVNDPFMPHNMAPPESPPPRKLFTYRPLSFLAFGILLFYALRTRRQYYLAVVYLSSSKWAYAVTGNVILAAAVSSFDGIVKVFLQGLRQHEAESLQDFFRWNVTETCLALTMFRHELTVYTMLQFVALITVKCLHHVAAQREQHLRMTSQAVQETFPYITSGHLRLLFFLIVLQLVDLYALQTTVTDLLENGPTVSILFAFEAAIMLVNAWSHILLWHLHVVDSIVNHAHENQWPQMSRLLHPWKEYKATLTFAVELQAQAVNFLFYSTFFAIVLTYYGTPINLFREVYVSFTLLRERLTAFLKYRHLMASMNRFEGATDEQLDEAGRTCIICRDEMCVQDCKRLPVCAHTFHKSCLREWLVQQQSCPTCRADIAAMEQQEATRNAAAAAAAQREGDEATDQQDEDHARNGENSNGTGLDEAAFTRRTKRARETPSQADIVHLFTVVHKNGVQVLSEDFCTSIRTIPYGTLVLVTEHKENWLRVPGGWITPSSARSLHTASRDSVGEWIHTPDNPVF